MATVAAMSGAVKEVDPPNHLRSRVIAMVAPEQKRRWVILPWAVSGLLTIALLSVAIARSPRRNRHGDTTKLTEALSHS